MSFQLPWDGAFRLQQFVHRTSEAFPAATVESIRQAILTSPLLDENHLTDQFVGSYGFSISFWRESLPEVKERFPAFVPFLDTALLTSCNVFLLNPLLIQNGRGVSTHLDRSLIFYDGRIGGPVAVSVLYVQVPQPLAGGELRLYHRGRQVEALSPMQGSLVMFRGDLVHEVVSVSAGAPALSAARISLVVEQYRVPESLRTAVPRIELRARGGVLE
ncbi:2OG-Fe(II) oxygenase [Hyalangium versicolor]|uniref:2OG-Fe(II) oxygenase n=1 Tax=Hyalangium versicolor TaxID=2861190 RepID=UPI001CCBECAB|nr:2OG-Fe(II) oxygenase [Hyalangium versicolor]